MYFSDLIVIGITIIAAISYGTTFSFAKDPVTVETFPWSLLLFGIGGFLGIIAIMLLFVITCAWQKYGAYDEKERFSFDDMSTSDKRHNTQRHDGYDNPQYPEPHDPRKSYFEWYNGRHYNNSRESGMYRDFVDDYKNSSKNNLGAGYSNGGYGSDYNRDYRPDIRDTRNYRYYFPGRYDADYYMYRPHSQTRY